jgi:signal transduction histidine kinase
VRIATKQIEKSLEILLCATILSGVAPDKETESRERSMSQNSGNQTELELKYKMATEIAHELRTPLGGILGINELLLSSRLDPDQKLLSETINDSAKIMLQLLTDFVDLARLDAGKVVLKNSSFNLDSTIEECALALRKFLAMHSIDLKISVDAKVPELITGDAASLQQILRSIILGASKFIESGTISIDARLENEKNSETVCFTVVLPPNTVNRNNQAIFTQLADEDTPVQRFDSTWLRLRIAHSLLQLMNASIQVSGNTLTFMISFSS